MSNSRITNKSLRKGFSKQKGFSVVELVIVIAVIGILAAVLIPTFNSIIKSSNESRAKQEIIALIKEYYIENTKDLDELIISYNFDDGSDLLFDYKDKELNIITSDYKTINNEILIGEHRYIEEINNSFPEHIKIYKQDLSFIRNPLKLQISKYTEKYFFKETIEKITNTEYYYGDTLDVTLNKDMFSFENNEQYEVLLDDKIIKIISSSEDDFKIEYVITNNLETINICGYKQGDITNLSTLRPFLTGLESSKVNQIIYANNRSSYDDVYECSFIQNKTTKDKDIIDNFLNKLKQVRYQEIEPLDYYYNYYPRFRKIVIETNEQVYEFDCGEKIKYNTKLYRLIDGIGFPKESEEGLVFSGNYITEKHDYVGGHIEYKSTDIAWFQYRTIVFKELDRNDPAYKKEITKDVELSACGTFFLQTGKIFYDYKKEQLFEIITNHSFDEIINNKEKIKELVDNSLNSFELLTDKYLIDEDLYKYFIAVYDNNEVKYIIKKENIKTTFIEFETVTESKDNLVINGVAYEKIDIQDIELPNNYVLLKNEEAEDNSVYSIGIKSEIYSEYIENLPLSYKYGEVIEISLEGLKDGYYAILDSDRGADKDSDYRELLYILNPGEKTFRYTVGHKNTYLSIEYSETKPKYVKVYFEKMGNNLTNTSFNEEAEGYYKVGDDHYFYIVPKVDKGILNVYKNNQLIDTINFDLTEEIYHKKIDYIVKLDEIEVDEVTFSFEVVNN